MHNLYTDKKSKLKNTNIQPQDVVQEEHECVANSNSRKGDNVMHMRQGQNGSSIGGE
jgi:hypothetical protein